MVSATADAVGGIALAQVIGAVLSVGYGVWQSNIMTVGFGFGMLTSAFLQVTASNASIEEYNAFQARRAKVRGWEQAQEEVGLGKVQNLQVLEEDYSVATSLGAQDLASTPSVKILLHDMGQFLKRQNISSMNAVTHYCYPCENGALAGVRQCDREAEGYGLVEESSSSPHVCEAL